MCQHTDFSVAAIDAALETGLPLWIGTSAQTRKGSDSLSVFDHEDRDYHSLVEALAGFPAMIMNIMHTPVSDVDSAIETTRKTWNGPIGVYPESGYFTMPNWQFVDVIGEQELVDHAQRWVDDGIRLVGGCCGLGPGHIAAMRQAFE
jgi:homocysteine S-methyltransferase